MDRYTKLRDRNTTANTGAKAKPIQGYNQLGLPFNHPRRVTKKSREKAGISAGDKLAVISLEAEGKVCCISLIRANDFAETVRGMLGPMMKGILG